MRDVLAQLLFLRAVPVKRRHEVGQRARHSESYFLKNDAKLIPQFSVTRWLNSVIKVFGHLQQ